jgi:hypothetical protein
MTYNQRRIRMLCAAVLLVCIAPTVLAQGSGDDCCCQDGHTRAGNPQSVARYARPSYTCRRYGGYYVGGGAPYHGDARCPDEGTWGWDYFGIIVKKRVALGWWHGAKEQGGTGAYATDGPKLKHD